MTAVSLHLRSDVPVGILLSGGVDSSGVAAFAARSGNNYTALCAGYMGDSPHDERQQAHATARYLGLPHEDVILDTSEYSQQFDQLVQRCDEPVGDWAAMPQWALYAQARQRGYKVLLSVALAGMKYFLAILTGMMLRSTMVNVPLQARNTWTGFHRLPHIQPIVFAGFIARGWPFSASSYRYRPASLRVTPECIMGSRRHEPRYCLGPTWCTMGVFLSDRLGMGCSVEVRVPLLDHVLIEAIFTLPLGRRFGEGKSKILLKQLLKGVVPNAVLDAPKRGFTPPTQYLEQLVASESEEICNGVLTKQWLERTKCVRS